MTIARSNDLTTAERRRVLAHWGTACAWVTAQVAELREVEEVSAPVHRDLEIRRRLDRDEDGVRDPEVQLTWAKKRGKR